MPTDTIEPIDQALEHLLAKEPESEITRAARLLRGTGLDLDSLAELVATALRRVENAPSARRQVQTVPHDVYQFSSDEPWTRGNPRTPGYSRAWTVTSVLTSVLPAPGGGWYALIGRDRIRHPDGRRMLFACDRLAMAEIEQVMRQAKLIVETTIS